MADGKWIEGLTPEMSAAAAARDVLAARFGVVQHYLPLAVENSSDDTENVHQLRVATRRAAAALRVFAACLPRKHHRAAKRSLKRIRQAAGDARDWDVFLLSLTAAKTLATDAAKPALDFLVGYGLGERTAAQARLADAVGESAPTFAKEWEELPRAARDPRGDDPQETFGDLAAAHLGQLIGALTLAADANPTKPPELHQLRIMAKRVRYALEIFADCFPPMFKEQVYPRVEHVQELLGEVQDAVVSLGRLSGLRNRLKKTVPSEWPRLQKGYEGLMSSLRARIPRGRRAFQKWRAEWTELVGGLKLEIGVATVTA